MDVTKTLEEVRRHKESVERVIASLEELQHCNASLTGSRQGNVVDVIR
jgi:hypothetical protein